MINEISLKIKLIDFGFSKIITSSNNLLTKVCGTPYYLPPEIILKKSYCGK